MPPDDSAGTDMVATGIKMPRRLRDMIDDQLAYNDSRARWIREAIRLRLREEYDIPEDEIPLETE